MPRTPTARRPTSPRDRASTARVRKNIMVDADLLAEVVRATGAKDQSDAVDRALRHQLAQASALRGLEESVGMFPDFPDLET